MPKDKTNQKFKNFLLKHITTITICCQPEYLYTLYIVFLLAFSHFFFYNSHIMNIAGLQKLTLLDYPGHTACTVFLAGCNFCCPFCHNAELINPFSAPPLMDETELLEFLKKRQGLLDGVCISGGEPTLQKNLPQLLQQIKNLGFQIKLDTNGTMPDVIKNLTDKNLINYIAMDIKASPENYHNLTGVATNLDAIKESVDFIKFCGIELYNPETKTGNVKQIGNTFYIKQGKSWTWFLKIVSLSDSNAMRSADDVDCDTIIFDEFTTTIDKYLFIVVR